MRSREKEKRLFITAKIEEKGGKLFSDELILKCTTNPYS